MFGGANHTFSIDGSTDNHGTWKVEVSNEAGTTSHSFEYRVFADADSDGLSDYREIHITLTNPNNSDSDGDGIDDATEINTYSSNPNSSDSDGDGFDDGTEVARGLNPTNSDAWIISYITNHPATFSLGTGGGYTLDEIRDLRAGSTLIGVSNNQATIRLQLDQSTNSTTHWESTPHVMETSLPADANTQFFRLRTE